MKFLILNGPNLNMLGTREPEIYGLDTLDTINKELEEFKNKLNLDVELDFFQSNYEGALIDKIQDAKNNYDGIIINPAGYTHTSIALADCIKGINLPTVEVHLSNIHSREDFRNTSYIAKNSIAQISGFGKNSYKLALLGLYKHLKNE